MKPKITTGKDGISDNFCISHMKMLEEISDIFVLEQKKAYGYRNNFYSKKIM